jgi:two-component sensor histidine kinase
MAPAPHDLASIIITDELAKRPSQPPDYLREKLAFRDLADDMADNPKAVLPRLVRLAMEACGAESAGISLLEHEVREFRWFGLHGALAAFEGTRTPLDFSPCGVTLQQNAPVLMQHPETVYGWIASAGISIPEVLLVPLHLRRPADDGGAGTLWVVGSKPGFFSWEHARVLTELAAFSSVAIRMIQAEEIIQSALQEQEQLTLEMAHRVKNLLAITDGMLRLTARTATTKEELVAKMSGRLLALANANQLVRRSFAHDTISGVGLQQLMETILKPYEHVSTEGPDVALGDHASNSMALVFHELATNAAKYGALSRDEGHVNVSWFVHQDRLELTWNESGGPRFSQPETRGFGSSLIETTIHRHNGTIRYCWLDDGVTVAIIIPLSSLTR